MSTCMYVPKAYTRLRNVSLCCAAIAPPPAVALTRRRKISVRYLRCSFTTLQQPPTINKERSLLKYHVVLLYILPNNFIYIYVLYRYVYTTLSYLYLRFRGYPDMETLQNVFLIHDF